MFWVLGFEGKSSSIFHHVFLLKKDMVSSIISRLPPRDSYKLPKIKKKTYPVLMFKWKKIKFFLLPLEQQKLQFKECIPYTTLFFVDFHIFLHLRNPPNSQIHFAKNHVTLHQDFDNIDPHIKMGLPWSKKFPKIHTEVLLCFEKPQGG